MSWIFCCDMGNSHSSYPNDWSPVGPEMTHTNQLYPYWRDQKSLKGSTWYDHLYVVAFCVFQTFYSKQQTWIQSCFQVGFWHFRTSKCVGTNERRKTGDSASIWKKTHHRTLTCCWWGMTSYLSNISLQFISSLLIYFSLNKAWDWIQHLLTHAVVWPWAGFTLLRVFALRLRRERVQRRICMQSSALMYVLELQWSKHTHSCNGF